MTQEEARLTLQENFGLLSFEHPGRISEAIKIAIEVLSQPSLPSGLDEYEDSLDYYHYTSDNPSVAYKAGYEQAESDTIERACDWLFAHLTILVDYYNEDIHENADRSEFIKLFRKQMEEE